MHTLIRHVFHDAVFTQKKGLVGNVVRSLNGQNEARSVRQRQYWPLVFSNFNIKKKKEEIPGCLWKNYLGVFFLVKSKSRNTSEV